MKKILIASVVVFITLGAGFAYAGSPLIPTKFYSAFYLNEKVQLAEQLEFLDGSLAGYIADKSVALDQKLAVINALQWNEKGKNNVETFKMFLGRLYGKEYDNLNLEELSGDELLCLGYMIALDKQRKLSDALPILEKAKAKNLTSYATQLIYTLATAQSLINSSKGCDAWKVCDALRNNTSLVQDFNAEANTIIFEQVDTYKDNCK
jgi:hypothetical protein